VTWAGKIVEWHGEAVVAPNEPRKFVVRVKFEPKGDFDSFSGMRPLVRALVYDPKKDKHILIKRRTGKNGGWVEIPYD